MTLYPLKVRICRRVNRIQNYPCVLIPVILLAPFFFMFALLGFTEVVKPESTQVVDTLSVIPNSILTKHGLK